MTIDIDVGNAYLIETPPNGSHLYVAIAYIPNSVGKYLFVNTTSKKDDLSCIIKPGPRIPSFINKESTICYRRAKELNSKQLARLLHPASNSSVGTFPEEVVNYIITRGLMSGRLKNKYKTMLRDLGY